MKESRNNKYAAPFALAAGVCLCPAFIASNACAASSVTLYGVIDQGFDYTNNSGGRSLLHLQDGTYDGVYGSRFGLKGQEDLGGGVSALFKLESGFSAENGELRQGGLLFGRQAYVGLSDARFGTITLGRQYDSVVDFLQPLTAAGVFGGPFVHAGDIDNTDDSFRANNSIKYTSPSVGGLTFGGVYAFTNTNAPGRGTTGLWSIGANYVYAGFNVAAAYLHAKNPASLLADGNYVANTSGPAIGAGGPFSYVGHAGDQQVYGAAASYALGPATLGLDYTDTRFSEANGTTATVKFDNYEAWAKYQLTSAWTVGGAYTYTHGDVGYSRQVPLYHQVGLTASYALSKTTSLYAIAVWQKAAGAATHAAIFNGVTGDASSNDHQIATRIGLYHVF